MIRRLFLRLSAIGFLGALFPSACKQASAPASRRVRLVSAAEISDGARWFELERVVVRRDNEGLSAMSMVCTHQTCLIRPESGGFLCPCHGSRFTPRGEVTLGPATVALPFYRLNLESDGILSVDFAAEVSPDWRLKL